MIAFDLKPYAATCGVFVETGTGHCCGIKAALRAGFDRVWSCDVDEELVQAAWDKFADDPRVVVQLCDSVEFVDCAAHLLHNERVFWWLDAHVDHGPVRGREKCPLLRELAAIRAAGRTRDVIAVDDRRLFRDNETRDNPDGWGQGVTEAAVLAALRRVNFEYRIACVDGYVPRDVIIAEVEG